MDQVKGHSVTGRASWKARSPAPMAWTAASGLARQKGAIAFPPGSARVCSQAPSLSTPKPRTRGTLAKGAAHTSRSRSADRSTGLPAGAHLRKDRRSPSISS
jgi:hypothetical protein